jgi:hypothetical protein
MKPRLKKTAPDDVICKEYFSDPEVVTRRQKQLRREINTSKKSRQVAVARRYLKNNLD